MKENIFLEMHCRMVRKKMDSLGIVFSAEDWGQHTRMMVIYNILHPCSNVYGIIFVLKSSTVIVPKFAL
jgi:hypothetical protein